MNEKIYVTRSSMPTYQEYIEEIKDLWDSHILTNMGEKHNTLRHQLSVFMDSVNVELVVNGHMAIELALQALGKKTGEVITTPFSFASTTHAIVRSGLTPVFCDIDPYTYTIDVNKIEELINQNTVAILPVHVYGNICDIESLDGISQKYGVPIIYDAAHAFGERYKGSSIGKYGYASCFSFHATKVFNTIEGGAITYGDEEYGSQIFKLKNFGITGEESVECIGTNAKLNEFCATMGICNLRHIDEEIARRKLVYEQYVERLETVSGIHINRVNGDVTSNYAYFPILVDEKTYGINRDELRNKMVREGIYPRKYFYPCINEYECYKGRYQSTPVAKKISEQILTLPLYADISLEQIDRICAAI